MDKLRNKKGIRHAFETSSKMAKVSFLSVMILNVNGLNAKWKKTEPNRMGKKCDPAICCLQETNFRSGNTKSLKMKEWEKVFQANSKVTKRELEYLYKYQTR